MNIENIEFFKFKNGILDQIAQTYNITEIVDKERIKAQLNTNIGEQIKIVHIS